MTPVADIPAMSIDFAIDVSFPSTSPLRIKEFNITMSSAAEPSPMCGRQFLDNRTSSTNYCLLTPETIKMLQVKVFDLVQSDEM